MVSFEKSDSSDGESENDGSDSGSSGTCTFPLRFDESVGSVGDSVGRVDDFVGCVSGVGSGFFVPIGINSIGDVVPLVVFVPKGVKSKGSQLIEIFRRLKSLFLIPVSKSVL